MFVNVGITLYSLKWLYKHRTTITQTVSWKW